ncbi:MAG: FAD-binding oxidoreductase, partial [Acetobacteraceae bacterium]|nr:FAD-binding oxidoreductase [Acetobacteraceae bacterium]
MRRQKKFYAWGYADEGLTADEIRPWEAELASHYKVSAFDVSPPPRADDIALRPSRVAVPAPLQPIVRTDHLARLEHSYGKAWFDTCRMFMRSVASPPDAVAFPETEQDIADVLDWCAQSGAKVIPYGGGSSVVKGIEPPDSCEKAVTLSMRHMDKVLEVDAVSQAARIQGGVYGPHLEDQLRDTPFTMRHYMQAYRCSTLGGWIATRSGGHYATLYTHIDDFVESTRVVTPAGVLETRRLPGSGAGPSPDRMMIGSEGILGIITEAWVRLREKPRYRAATSVRFSSFHAGADAVRGITQAGLYPANCRLLEAREALPGVSWQSEEAVLVLAFESADHPLQAWMSRALEICRDFGGTADAAGPDDENSHRGGAAGAWRNRFIRAPYYMEHAVARGLLSTTFETAMTWERLHDFHATIIKVARDAIRQVTGREGTVTCRFTHVYPDGPCLYFTLGGILDKRAMLEQCMAILTTCMTATVEHGGTTTHHHAVGRFHRPFYDKQRPELFARALRAAKREL